MPFIDLKCFNRTCTKYPQLDHVELRQAIYAVYEQWIRDVNADRNYIFHAYFGLGLLDMGIDDLFEAERYRKGIGHYFNQRAVRKLAEIRKALQSLPANPVEIARPNLVRIRINAYVSLEFGVIRGVHADTILKWSQIEERPKIIRFGNGTIDNEDVVRHHARRQALAVMNDKRQDVRLVA